MIGARRLGMLAALAAGVALIGVTRLPLLTSPHLVLDGDEAIVGMMARDMAEGRRLPIYFDGQPFGLSIVETTAGAVAFTVARPSTEALKIGMLALWIVGWVLFVLAIRRWLDGPTAIVAGLLLATCPAWGNWSTMARGYHVGGFVTAQAALLSLARLRDGRPRSPGALALAGALLGLLAITQSLWLVAVLPFVALALWGRPRAMRDIAALVAGVGAVLVLNAIVSRGQYGYWSPDYLVLSAIPSAAGRLARGLWVCLTGAYYYHVRLPAGPFAVAWTALWLAASATGCGWLLQNRTGSRGRVLGLTAALAVVAVLAAVSPFAPSLFGYRHLLPVTSSLTVIVAITVVTAVRRGGAARVGAGAVLALLATTGIGVILQVPRLWETRSAMAGTPARADLDALVRDLLDHGIGHAYSLGGMLQWNLMFSSDERVLARWRVADDRRPEIPRAVDRALWADRPTALVGSIEQMASTRNRIEAAGQRLGDAHVLGQSYFWIERPTPAALAALGFELHPRGDSGQPTSRTE